MQRTLIAELATSGPDVVVVDGSLGDFDVMRVCRDLRRSLAARIIVVPPVRLRTRRGRWQALHAGADDVLEQRRVRRR